MEIGVEQTLLKRPVPDGSAKIAAKPHEELKVYLRKKHAVAGAIRSLQELFESRHSEARAAECHDLMIKLAEDRFTLAVVGQFKRGKSSLMNAIIRRDLLPTGLLPLTSAVTILRFGPRERLLIPHDRWAFDEEVPLSALADYVTEQGNPGNKKQIKAVYVEIPSPFLRRGLEFVDTPGIGSAIEANTATTYGFLPRCDAVLFVTSVDAPFSAAETQFLRDLRQSIGKVFFIINKVDLLSNHERDDVLNFICNVLRRETAAGNVRMFPVSARAALAAKSHDERAASGISELESSLTTFLAAEKSATFLTSILGQSVRLLKAEADLQARFDPAEQNERRSSLLRRLEVLRNQINSEPDVQVSFDEHAEGAGESAENIIPIEKNRPAEEELNLPKLNLAKRTCPICDPVTHALFGFFSSAQYALATDERNQRSYAEELGFCPLHTWHLSSVASPLGLSLGYPRLIERLSADLSAMAAHPPDSGTSVTRLVATPRTCRACHFMHEEEMKYVRWMEQWLRESSHRDEYSRSQGVCLRHLAMLVDAASSKEMVQFLLTEAAYRFEELSEDMRSYAIKRDATRRRLVNKNEEDAYLRSLIHIVGGRYISTPNSTDA